ncbi:MAG: transglycosylase domain-containing protein [Deltaproteobacteria bacterium]|nr:transglycosylase domain-containing protein [Deltaproteobacteria bacterium]
MSRICNSLAIVLAVVCAVLTAQIRGNLLWFSSSAFIFALLAVWFLLLRLRLSFNLLSCISLWILFEWMLNYGEPGFGLFALVLFGALHLLGEQPQRSSVASYFEAIMSAVIVLHLVVFVAEAFGFDRCFSDRRCLESLIDLSSHSLCVYSALVIVSLPINKIGGNAMLKWIGVTAFAALMFLPFFLQLYSQEVGYASLEKLRQVSCYMMDLIMVLTVFTIFAMGLIFRCEGILGRVSALLLATLFCAAAYAAVLTGIPVYRFVQVLNNHNPPGLYPSPINSGLVVSLGICLSYFKRQSVMAPFRGGRADFIFLRLIQIAGACAIAFVSANILIAVGRMVRSPLPDVEVGANPLAPVLKRMVVASEDAGFCLHFGLDVYQLRAALLENLTAGEVVRGASTISMQLAKNLYLSPEKVLSRKIQQLVIAFIIELRFSKREIITLYLQSADFGEGVRGVSAAARHYFRKSAGDLDLNEAAKLALALRNPELYKVGHNLPDKAIADINQAWIRMRNAPPEFFRCLESAVH